MKETYKLDPNSFKKFKHHESIKNNNFMNEYESEMKVLGLTPSMQSFIFLFLLLIVSYRI